MVGIHKPCAPGYDPMPVAVRVVAESHVERVLESYQPCHRIRRRTVHPDLSVFIDRHKTESRIDGTVHNFERNAIRFSDWFPVGQGGATHRIDADSNPG